MIQLTDRLYLTADRYSFIVGERNPSKADKASMIRYPSYYATLSSALRGAVNRAMRQAVAAGELNSLQECVAETERLTLHFERLLQGVEPRTCPPAGGE